MSQNQPPFPNPFDPAAWRESRDSFLDVWSKAMVDAVNTEQYAQATGALLDAYLTASSPFRDTLEKSMQQALQQASMPSKADVISLAERLTNVEMKLDDIDAKLDRLLRERSEPAARATAPKSPKKKTVPSR
ncbi:MAG: hypothetical protein AB7I25_04320 [Vicinamibacterales bacterium]